MISQATYFSFERFEVEKDNQTVSFFYAIGMSGSKTLSFQDKIVLPAPISPGVPKALLSSILSSLHLILGISYWKLYCPKEIRIESGSLTEKQALFWNIVYTKGLGEFFYRNEIDFRGLIAFPFAQKVPPTPAVLNLQDRSLVGIAGGKDSLVSFEILKKAGKEMTPLVIETNHPYFLIRHLLEKESQKPLFIRHELDEKLHALNHTGLVYNGHVPVSAMYSFILLFAAVVYDYKYCVVSNEKSASYGNVDYLGMEVNHQWSKSEEYESMMRSYVEEFITPSITYFSLLRPLLELKIVQMFSGYKKYFSSFSSCNKNFTVFEESSHQKWCGTCPKCAFMFVLLSAFLTKNEVVGIFGKNLFEDEELVSLYRQLLGIEDIKPFDCVGTPEEVVVAFYMAYQKGEFKGSAVMDMFEKRVAVGIKDISKLQKHVLALESLESLPDEFKNIFNI